MGRATDLHGVLKGQLPPEVLEQIPNYRCPLTGAFRMSDREREKFDPAMGAVLERQRYAKDCGETAKPGKERNGFAGLPKYAVNVLDSCFGAKIETNGSLNVEDDNMWSYQEHVEIAQMAKDAANFAHNLKIPVTEAVDAMEVRGDMREDILRIAKKRLAEPKGSDSQTED